MTSMQRLTIEVLSHLQSRQTNSVFRFDINSKEVVQLTAKLERLNATIMPKVVASTLNELAFDMKKKQIPKSAKIAFINRKPNFFDVFSKFTKTKIGSINTMQSEAGMIDGKRAALKNMDNQEDGEDINNDLIARDNIRVSNSRSKMVRSVYSLENIPKVSSLIDASKVKARNANQRYVKAAFMARKLHGNNAYILGNIYKGRQTLSKIGAMSSDFKTRKLNIERTPLYSFKKNRSVPVKSKGFINRAGFESGLKVDFIYITNARRQFDKLFR